MFHFMQVMEKATADTSEEYREKMLEHCRAQLHGYEGLIPREMISIDSSPIAEHKREKGLAPAAEQCSDGKRSQLNRKHPFRLLQWNILADALAESTPVSNFNKVPLDCLDWSFRHVRIIEHILQLNADIVCLQEVDHYQDLFEPVFTKLGFKGFFQPKQNSPCLRNPQNNGPDGVALFFRGERFRCVENASMYLNNEEAGQGNQPIIICCLEDQTCKRKLVIGVVHLKAKAGFEKLRCTQAKDSISKICDFISRKSIESPSIMLVGDFNGDPEEPFYESLSNSSQPKLTSVYCELRGKEPSFTTWKFRDSKEFKRSIDYIWCSGNSLQGVGYLDLPREEDVPGTLLPHWSYPSDHISLCCDFSYV